MNWCLIYFDSMENFLSNNDKWFIRFFRHFVSRGVEVESRATTLNWSMISMIDIRQQDFILTEKRTSRAPKKCDPLQNLKVKINPPCSVPIPVFTRVQRTKNFKEQQGDKVLLWHSPPNKNQRDQSIITSQNFQTQQEKSISRTMTKSFKEEHPLGKSNHGAYLRNYNWGLRAEGVRIFPLVDVVLLWYFDCIRLSNHQSLILMERSEKPSRQYPTAMSFHQFQEDGLHSNIAYDMT